MYKLINKADDQLTLSSCQLAPGVIIKGYNFPKGFRRRKKTGKKVEMKVNSPAKLNRWLAMFFKVQRTNSRHNFTD